MQSGVDGVSLIAKPPFAHDRTAIPPPDDEVRLYVRFMNRACRFPPPRASRLALLAAAIAVLAASCSSGTKAPTKSASGAARQPTTTTQRRKAATRRELSAGCRSRTATAPTVQDEVRHLTVDGTAHTYHLWAPATRRPLRATPLVLLFHGFANNGEGIAKLSRLPIRGVKRGLTVAAPDGPGQTWEFTGNGTDAVFVDGLVASLTSSRCVDLRRVYVAGFSAGAAFSIAYACARPDRIAALATVAVEFQLGCKKPTAILDFHGTDDPLVPYRDGAVGLSLPGVHVRGTPLNMADWAKLGRCARMAPERSIGTDVRLATWEHCADGAEVSLYTIEHGGHAWPLAKRTTTTSSTRDPGLDATGLMLDFFHRHKIK